MDKAKKIKQPLNRSITIGCVCFILLLCGLLSIANLEIYKEFVYNDYRGYISDILDYTIAHIDGDDLQQCIETREESPKYKETLLFMDNLMDHFSDIHYFYSVCPLHTGDKENCMSVFSAERYYDRYINTEGNLYLGWIYGDEFTAREAALMFEIMSGDEIVFFEEKTVWGTDYTGAAPIRNSAGESIAVLAVDIDISFLNAMIKQYAVINTAIISAAGALFIGVFLLWSRKNITAPIKKLEESAVGFADHSHGQRNIDALRFEAPEIKANNEIRSLSEAVEKMADDMRDYVSDIISAENKAEKLQELANRDPLTGVRNKTAYDHEIRRLEPRIAQGDTKIGLAIADLNYLKRINDSYGHDRGNEAIRKLCELICTVFVHSPVFRIGGDEFAVILRENDYDNCDRLIERFEDEIRRMASNERLAPWEKVSAAIGVAFYDGAVDDSLESLFRRADLEMYEKKKQMKAVRSE